MQTGAITQRAAGCPLHGYGWQEPVVFTVYRKLKGNKLYHYLDTTDEELARDKARLVFGIVTSSQIIADYTTREKQNGQ